MPLRHRAGPASLLFAPFARSPGSHFHYNSPQALYAVPPPGYSPPLLRPAIHRSIPSSSSSSSHLIAPLPLCFQPPLINSTSGPLWLFRAQRYSCPASGHRFLPNYSSMPYINLLSTTGLAIYLTGYSGSHNNACRHPGSGPSPATTFTAAPKSGHSGHSAPLQIY